MNANLNIEFLEDASEILRAVAHPLRIAIMQLLEGAGKKLSVTEIHESLEIEQAIASHHLRILKDRKILSSQRDGKNTFYFLRSQEAINIVKTLEKIV